MSTKIKVKNSQLNPILNALKNLDGKPVPVKSGEQVAIVNEPYQFSAKTRWNIVRNIKAVEGHVDDLEKTRIALVKSFAKDGSEVSKEDMPEFQKEFGELIAQECEVGVLMLKEEDLNLDKNDIPGSVLAHLLPLIVLAPDPA